MDYKALSKSELEELLKQEQKAYKKLQKADRHVDMTRGKPSKEQLDISMPMLDKVLQHSNHSSTKHLKTLKHIYIVVTYPSSTPCIS